MHIRQLDYGNLFLRRQMHHYLGSGVLFSIVLLLLFWFVTFNWDDVASAGRRSSGKGSPGDSYELVTAMVQLAPPPPLLSASVAVSPVTRPAVSSNAGKVAMVSEDQAPLALPYAMQSEIKQELRNQEAGKRHT